MTKKKKLRVFLPQPKSKLEKIMALIEEAYNSEDVGAAEQAFIIWLDYYRVDVEKTQLEWSINSLPIDDEDSIRCHGYCSEDGEMMIVHPTYFKHLEKKRKHKRGGRKYWVDTVIHEWSHLVTYAHAEERAGQMETEFRRLAK